MRVPDLIEAFVLGTGVGLSVGSVSVIEAGVGAHSALISYDEPIAIRTPRGIFVAERPSPELLWSPTTEHHLSHVHNFARARQRAFPDVQQYRLVSATREEIREIAGYDPDAPADGVRVPGTRVSRDRYGRQMSFQGVAA